MDENELSKAMAEMGRRGGRASAKKLTKKQRIARAKKAVAAREKKRGKQ